MKNHGSANLRSRRPQTSMQWFLSSWYWRILKNVLGWPLVLLSLVAGPLVPGPGGLPLFLLGFALISFPGKRRLTARVLRGSPLQIMQRPFALTSLMISMGVAAIVVWAGRKHLRTIGQLYEQGPQRAFFIYAIAFLAAWAAMRIAPRLINFSLRLISRARHRFRPWLRKHHIRLLPRWRIPYADEPGHGAFRLTESILRFVRHQR